MNTRYTETFLFLSRLSRRSDKGFAMGFVLTAGVLMAATGAVMLLRSSSETEKVVAQQTIAKSKTTTEVAIARMHYLLGQYPFVAEFSHDDWQTTAFDNRAKEEIEQQLKNSCKPYTQEDINARKQEIDNYVKSSPWIPIDESNAKFRITDYKAAIAGKEMGELTLESIANAGNKLKEAPSKVVVKIPLSENSSEIQNGPGLWVQNGNGLDDIVAGHVWIGSGGDDCSVADNAAKIAEINNQVFGDPTSSNNKGGLAEAIKDGELTAGTTFKPAKVAEHKFPDKEKLDETYAKQITENGVTPININTLLASNPTQSPLSTIAHGMNEFAEKAFNKMLGGVAFAAPKKTSPGQDKKDSGDTGGTTSGDSGDAASGGSGGSCGTQIDASKNGDWKVFPQPDDTPTRTETSPDGKITCIYDYEITQDLGSVQAAIRTVNAEGKRQRVIFHLHGNIDKNTEIAHIGDDDISSIGQVFKMPDCSGACKPVDFQIWGHTTTSVCMNGNKKLHTFLWAPLADLGMMGGGNGKGGLNGTAFVSTWNQTCGSNSKSSAHVVQTGEWTDLGLDDPEITPPMTVGQPANVRVEQYYSE
ncbi:MAG: hypothetical protein QNJ42_20810 [Crocosphaera sp.]|nr:hypothetical protein [Crocosphaera sp.]